MALAKKELFTVRNILAQDRVRCENAEFPPKKFTYKKLELTCLGPSNHADLKVKSAFDETDKEMVVAFKEGKIDQYIYSDPSGELFEALLIDSIMGGVVVCAIRTRRLPDKK